MNFQQLWDKFKAGQASQEEMKMLAGFLEKQEGIEALKAAVEVQWDKTPQDVTVNVKEAQRKAIFKKIQPKAKVVAIPRQARSIRMRWASIAAALGLLIISTLVYLNFQRSATPTWVTVQTFQDPKQVELPDGSTAWVNRNSTLSYKTPFPDTLRLLELEGEGFFEVVSDKRPFIVASGGIQTRVLGTVFNVNAYPNQDEVEVALLEGNVVVNTPISDTVSLDPGELVRVRKKDMSLQKATYLGDQYHAWLKGIIHFDGADVKEVTKTLSNWYSIQFEVEDEHLMESELVYRFDTNQFTFEEVVQHINTVSDYTISKSTNNLYTIKHK